MTKFKAGDQVKITHKPIGLDVHNSGWVDEMDRYIGSIVTVTKTFDTHDWVQCAVGDRDLLFPDVCLSLVDLPDKGDLRFSYQEKQRACGITVGDKVRITRRAKTHEDGWGEHWCFDMDRFIGKCGVVISESSTDGFAVKVLGRRNCLLHGRVEPGVPTGYYYPYFVLERFESGHCKEGASSNDTQPPPEKKKKKKSPRELAQSIWGARFRFQDGHEIETPAPTFDQPMTITKDLERDVEYAWPPEHVVRVDGNDVTLKAGSGTTKRRFVNSAHQCWIRDMGYQISEGQPQMIATWLWHAVPIGEEAEKPDPFELLRKLW